MLPLPRCIALVASVPVLLLQYAFPQLPPSCLWYWLPLHIAVWYGGLCFGLALAGVLALCAGVISGNGSPWLVVQLVTCAGLLAWWRPVDLIRKVRAGQPETNQIR